MMHGKMRIVTSWKIRMTLGDIPSRCPGGLASIAAVIVVAGHEFALMASENNEEFMRPWSVPSAPRRPHGT